jgi:hypothetical protein
MFVLFAALVPHAHSYRYLRHDSDRGAFDGDEEDDGALASAGGHDVATHTLDQQRTPAAADGGHAEQPVVGVADVLESERGDGSVEQRVQPEDDYHWPHERTGDTDHDAEDAGADGHTREDGVEQEHEYKHEQDDVGVLLDYEEKRMRAFLRRIQREDPPLEPQASMRRTLVHRNRFAGEHLLSMLTHPRLAHRVVSMTDHEGMRYRCVLPPGAGEDDADAYTLAIQEQMRADEDLADGDLPTVDGMHAHAPSTLCLSLTRVFGLFSFFLWDASQTFVWSFV